MTVIETLRAQMNPEQIAILDRAIARQPGISTYRACDFARHILCGYVDVCEVSDIRQKKPTKADTLAAVQRKGHALAGYAIRPATSGQWAQSASGVDYYFRPTPKQREITRRLLMQALKGTGVQPEWSESRDVWTVQGKPMPNEIESSDVLRSRLSTYHPAALAGEFAVRENANKYIRYQWSDARRRWVRSGIAIQLRGPIHSWTSDQVTYWEHGKTEAACLAELRRKVEIASRERRDRETQERRSNRDARRAQLIARICHQAVITAADVRDTGACQAGIEAWCRAHHIDPNSSMDLPTLAGYPDARPWALRIARKLRRAA